MLTSKFLFALLFAHAGLSPFPSALINSAAVFAGVIGAWASAESASVTITRHTALFTPRLSLRSCLIAGCDLAGHVANASRLRLPHAIIAFPPTSYTLHGPCCQMVSFSPCWEHSTIEKKQFGEKVPSPEFSFEKILPVEFPHASRLGCNWRM
jgi:hypothetical protein